MNHFTTKELTQLAEMYENTSSAVAQIIRGAYLDNYTYREAPKVQPTDIQLRKNWSRYAARVLAGGKFVSYTRLRQLIFESPLRDLPTLIGDPVFEPIATWRFKLGK